MVVLQLVIPAEAGIQPVGSGGACFFPSSEARFPFELVISRAVSTMVPNGLLFGDSFDQAGSLRNSC
jgi:hypothetical protein